MGGGGGGGSHLLARMLRPPPRRPTLSSITARSNSQIVRASAMMDEGRLLPALTLLDCLTAAFSANSFATSGADAADKRSYREAVAALDRGWARLLLSALEGTVRSAAVTRISSHITKAVNKNDFALPLTTAAAKAGFLHKDFLSIFSSDAPPSQLLLSEPAELQEIRLNELMRQRRLGDLRQYVAAVMPNKLPLILLRSGDVEGALGAFAVACGSEDLDRIIPLAASEFPFELVSEMRAMLPVRCTTCALHREEAHRAGHLRAQEPAAAAYSPCSNITAFRCALIALRLMPSSSYIAPASGGGASSSAGGLGVAQYQQLADWAIRAALSNFGSFRRRAGAGLDWRAGAELNAWRVAGAPRASVKQARTDAASCLSQPKKALHLACRQLAHGHAHSEWMQTTAGAPHFLLELTARMLSASFCPADATSLSAEQVELLRSSATKMHQLGAPAAACSMLVPVLGMLHPPSVYATSPNAMESTPLSSRKGKATGTPPGGGATSLLQWAITPLCVQLHPEAFSTAENSFGALNIGAFGSAAWVEQLGSGASQSLLRMLVARGDKPGSLTFGKLLIAHLHKAAPGAGTNRSLDEATRLLMPIALELGDSTFARLAAEAEFKKSPSAATLTALEATYATDDGAAGFLGQAELAEWTPKCSEVLEWLTLPAAPAGAPIFVRDRVKLLLECKQPGLAWRLLKPGAPGDSTEVVGAVRAELAVAGGTEKVNLLSELVCPFVADRLERLSTLHDGGSVSVDSTIHLQEMAASAFEACLAGQFDLDSRHRTAILAGAQRGLVQVAHLAMTGHMNVTNKAAVVGWVRFARGLHETAGAQAEWFPHMTQFLSRIRSKKALMSAVSALA